MTMHVSGFRKTIALGALLGLILLAGCSRLPAYIQPRVEISDASRNSKVVSYRELTIADFSGNLGNLEICEIWGTSPQ